MSDLSSSDEQPPSPPVARRTRPKTKASTPRRAIKPAALPTNVPGAAKSKPQAKEPAAEPAPPAKQSETPVQSEPEVVETTQDRFTYKVRDTTIISKPILLWAVIVGVATFIVATGPSLTFSALGVTPKQLDANPDLEGVLGWATLILSIGLPVVGGWRATAREGRWIQGGMTGFWSNVVFTICLIIYYVIAAAILKELDQINGSFFISLFLEYIVFQGLLGFGLGTMGGWYSTYQRRRAQQAREVAASSS